MKKHTLCMTAMLALLLTFGLMLGCDTGGGGTTNNNGGGTTYTVSFDSGEGSGNAPSSQTVSAGATINLPGKGGMTAPAGKTFKGWRAGGQNYSSGDSYTVTDNITFIAQWVSDGTGNGGNNNGNNNSEEESKPSAPTGVKAVAGSSSITISWNSVSGASSYKIYYSITGSSPGSLYWTTTNTSYTDTRSFIADGNTYYYKVSAVNSAGESGPSAIVSAKIDSSSGGGGTSKPSAPTGVSAAAGSSSILISWNSVSDASSYKIYYSVTGSSPSTLYWTTTNTSYVDARSYIDDGNTYYYKVSAVNSAGESSPSAIVSAKISSSPSAPTGVTATKLSSSSVSVSWSSVSNATSYNVYYSTNGSSYTYDGRTTSTSYTRTGLSGASTAYFKITAVNSAGESGYSSVASVSLSGGGGTSSYGSIKIINNSSHTIGNITIYQYGYDLLSLSGIVPLLNSNIYKGGSVTIENIEAGSYTEMGSATYAGYKIRRYTDFTITAGQTTTITITDSDFISN